MKSESREAASRLPERLAKAAPAGADRRSFMVRSAMVGAVSVLSGCAPAKDEVSTAEKVGPGPSSSHTIGPIRITVDVQAQEMNSKYKETSEGGLAVSVVLC
jgi:hypothetical protein